MLDNQSLFVKENYYKMYLNSKRLLIVAGKTIALFVVTYALVSCRSLYRDDTIKPNEEVSLRIRSLKDTYRIGEPIHLILTLSNNSDVPLLVCKPYPGDILITRKGKLIPCFISRIIEKCPLLSMPKPLDFVSGLVVLIPQESISVEGTLDTWGILRGDRDSETYLSYYVKCIPEVAAVNRRCDLGILSTFSGGNSVRDYLITPGSYNICYKFEEKREQFADLIAFYVDRKKRSKNLEDSTKLKEVKVEDIISANPWVGVLKSNVIRIRFDPRPAFSDKVR